MNQGFAYNLYGIDELITNWEPIIEDMDAQNKFKSKIVCIAEGTRTVTVDGDINKVDLDALQDYFWIADNLIIIKDSLLDGDTYSFAAKLNEDGMFDESGSWQNIDAKVTVTDYLIDWKLDVTGDRADHRENLKVKQVKKDIVIDRVTGKYTVRYKEWFDDVYDSKISDRYEGSCNPIGEPKF